MKQINVPFAPGDDLYCVDVRCDGAPGPAIVEIRKDRQGIRGIQVGLDGETYIVPEGSGKPEIPGGPCNCLTRSDAEDWLHVFHPGAILLDGSDAVAAVMTSSGAMMRAEAKTTMAWLSDMVPGTLWTTEPDRNGTVAVYDKTATKENTAFATFVRDASGEPVDVIYGRFIMLGTEIDPDTGMRHIRNIPKAILDSLERRQPQPEDDGPREYDPDRWSVSRNMTAGRLRDYLSRFPDNAKICCCGTDEIYLHHTKDGAVISIDCDSLAELPEYDDREPVDLDGK